ncbi:sacsin N-terminal ATP-binding-like domain-containing protein [Desulfosarcina ovata]|uniref:Sacsin/Nov domain-containing protein n=1 Tax=Desulfosarcina ovata subsp. ovata TaxID=2752305 RepID=A0A5K8AD90_9BACT|nr:hypothetical protein [Desulfosarcina ovata]BBO89910.1 hypothetical protein DSCOOX_30900 [Desulfosarcina ovata subsp. ovata]
MPSNYDHIRNDEKRNEAILDKALKLLGKMYSDRTHFVFELLQNAEDARASKVLFNLFEDKLEVFHDGRLFDEKDVRGICGVGEGTKAEDLTQIGKFGIGFKSVYAYTTTPEIHSGHESFRIENYVRPYAVQPRIIGDLWTTHFVFPFNRPDVNPEIACKEISGRLRKLSARTLLFLRNIKEIEYRLLDGMEGVYLRDEAIRGAAREVTVIGQNNGVDESESWLIFERPVEVPDPGDDCPRHVPVEIGFHLEKNEEERRDEVARVKDSPLVVYFPTEKETRFGFLIQGPYKTTPARDNIPKEDDWNANLVRETACLIVDVLPQLKGFGLLDVSLLEALPIRMEDFPSGSMFFPIAKAVRNTLMDQELLPTDDKTYVSAQNAKLASAEWLRNILRNDHLRLLYQKDFKWINGEITETGRYSVLWKYIRQELQVEEVTPDSFSRKIDNSFLEEQSDEWLVRFYGYLLDTEKLWRSPRWSGDSGGLLRSKPIVRLQDDAHVPPFRADGTTPNAYLPPPEDTDFPIVKRSIASDEQAGSFLKRLDLSEPDVFDDIVERVLPKYSKEDVSLISEAEHAADIQKIMRALTSDSEAGKKKVVKEARQTPFLKATDPFGNLAFKKPCVVYQENPDLRLYFSGSTDVWFLSEKASATDPSVWSELGVARKPRFRKMQVDLPWEERSRLRGNQGHTRDIETIDYDIDGLDSFLSNVPQDSQQLIGYSLIIWGFLLEHLKESSYYQFYEGQYRWFYYQERTAYFTATWKRQLRGCSWIPKYGSDSPFKPGEVSLGDLPDQFDRNEKLADLLGMKKDVVFKLAEEAGIPVEDIDLLRRFPEEFSHWKAQIAEQNERPAFPSRTVANPERRQERIWEQLADSPKKEYEERERSVRKTRGAVDPSIWLREQYTNDAGQMVCQICKEEMPFRKRDGQYYFESVEALSVDYFTREHEAQYLALCPVCAARYKEFVKLDERVMEALNQVLRASDEGEVPLNLGELETSIKFVGSHFIDMKAILEAED